MLELQQTGWGWETGMVHTSIIVPLQEIKKKKKAKKKRGQKSSSRKGGQCVDGIALCSSGSKMSERDLRQIQEKIRHFHHMERIN